MSSSWFVRGALALASVAVTSCGGGVNIVSDLGPPPKFFAGFPAETWMASENADAFVNVEAAFLTNHARVLGTDVTELGLLPVRVTVGLRGTAMTNAQIRLDSDQLDLRLYLPDGTVLAPVSTKEVIERAGAKTGPRLAERALEAGVLPDYETARSNPRFAFFDLAPKSSVLDGAIYGFQVNGRPVSVDISKGLIAFNVMIENKLEPFYVGIRAQ